jgi:hypothetical protein
MFSSFYEVPGHNPQMPVRVMEIPLLAFDLQLWQKKTEVGAICECEVVTTKAYAGDTAGKKAFSAEAGPGTDSIPVRGSWHHL